MAVYTAVDSPRGGLPLVGGSAPEGGAPTPP